MHFVTSRVCATTLAVGGKFSDSNLAATLDALKLVNLDATRTGGIQTIWTTGAAKQMADFTIEFAADLEMVEGHAHPPVLTTRVRPNLVIDGRYCICAITKTDPPEGIPARSRGSFHAAALCSAEDADRFVAGGTFELRDGPKHIFAKGVFREVGAREEYHPA